MGWTSSSSSGRIWCPWIPAVQSPLQVVKDDRQTDRKIMSDRKSGFDFTCPMLLKFKAMRTQERRSRIKRGVPQGSTLGPLLFAISMVSQELN